MNIAACVQLGYYERVAVDPSGFPMFLPLEEVDGEEVLFLRFHPIQARLKYYRAEDSRDVPVDPEAGDPIDAEEGNAE